MARGYKVLVADKFFGDVDNIDWNKVKLIDKINLEAKIGNLLDVPFSDEEKILLDKTMNTEKFSEVLDVVRDILAYTKENQEDLMQMPEMDDSNMSEEENEDPGSDMGHDDMEGMNDETERNETQSESNESNDDNEAEKNEESAELAPEPKHTGDEDFSVTDEIFRSMEKSLIPDQATCYYGNELKKNDWKDNVILFDELMEKRIRNFDRKLKMAKNDDFWGDITLFENQMPLTNYQETTFLDYIKKAKKSIQPAVKEFEQRKAATRWKYASTAKTGRLDVNKLHNYKLTEDIFLKTTRLADEKSHGMFMLIDYSGSMSGQLSNVIEQVIHSVLFCKAVNIPFEVYSFSTNSKQYKQNNDYFDGDLYMDNLSLCQLIHSKLKRKDFETALKWLYARLNEARGVHNDWIRANEEDWGSTPLNQALIVCHKLIRDFKFKNNIEKVTLLSITDGDTNRLRVIEDSNIEKVEFASYWKYSSRIKLPIDGKMADIGTGREGTKDLYDNLRKRYNVNVMGFFVADGNIMLKNKLYDCYEEETGNSASYYDEDFTEFRKAKVKENTKNKCIAFKDTLGYDSFFIVKGDNFNIEDNDLESYIPDEDDFSDAKLKQAFKKMARNKKTNKNLMTKFGQAVAV